MRAVLQRVSESVVKADGKETGSIQRGLLVFLGIERSDTIQDLDWLVDKLPRVRCFEDESGRMNRNLLDCGGQIMVISQFTLFGSLKKGTRPSFNRAADPEQAIPLYEQFVEKLTRAIGRPVATGVFGAEMEITAVNDGPVTLIIDTRNREF